MLEKTLESPLDCKEIQPVHYKRDQPWVFFGRNDAKAETPSTLATSCDMFFPVVMYECESWTIMKAEHQRTDAFELWCWRRLLRVPWTARRSDQSILKEINPEYSLEGLMLMLRLNLQYLNHLI